MSSFCGEILRLGQAAIACAPPLAFAAAESSRFLLLGGANLRHDAQTPTEFSFHVARFASSSLSRRRVAAACCRPPPPLVFATVAGRPALPAAGWSRADPKRALSCAPAFSILLPLVAQVGTRAFG